MDRVVEIGGYAAAYCGRMFVRAGADVVRIDHENAAPAWASEEAMALFLHSGKRRVATTDLDLIAQLVAKADVVICDLPNADALLAIGFDDWQAPVKVATTPFGRTGPKRNWHATPSTILAMGGYTNLVGDADREPLSLPGHYVEFQTGALAYSAANTCRYAQCADSVDISMLETVMSLSQFTTVRWHCAGEERTRHGSDFWFVVPSELFKCTDGWVYINIVPSFWDALTVFIDRPELLVDERFSTNDLRMQNRQELHEYVGAAVSGYSRQGLLDRAEECRIPLGAVLSFDEVLADPHLRSRDFWEESPGPNGELIKVPGMPYVVNGAPRPKLSLGAHEQEHAIW